MTKHLLLGGGAVLVAIIALTLGLMDAAGDATAGQTKASKLAFHQPLVPAERALNPIQPKLTGDDDSGSLNPFVLRASTERKAARLPFPPPPTLTLPPLPVLPLLER